MPRFSTMDEVFDGLATSFQADNARDARALIQLDLTGAEPYQFWIRVEAGSCTANKGLAPNPDLVLQASVVDWLKISNDELNALSAFLRGKVKVTGDLSLAFKMQRWFA